MPELSVILAFSELGLAGLASLPFLLHRWRVGRWVSRGGPTHPGGNFDGHATMILPVWNEEVLIEEKLSALSTQDVDWNLIELLIIDSASTDSTMDKVETWLKEHADVFPRRQIIRMERRQGKTEAVRRAMLAADESSGILMMTDVDARIREGGLSRLLAWFNDPTIGAVGGTPFRLDSSAKAHADMEATYRDMFTLQRLGESAVDSTPFLEGSIIGFRRELAPPESMETRSNADDSQIATMVRLNGGRSIQDEELVFEENTPPSSAGRRGRKVRRAQGLIRHLWRNRSHWFSRSNGRFGGILGWQAMMHIIVPWFILISMMLGFSRWAVLGDGIVSTSLLMGLFIIEGLILLALLLNWMNQRVPGLGLLQTFLDSMQNLLIAQWHLIRGRSLHVWKQPERV